MCRSLPTGEAGVHTDRADDLRRAFTTRRTFDPGNVADGRGCPRRRRVGPGGGRESRGNEGGTEGEQPLLRARGRHLLRRDPDVDRAPRARPHDPGQGLRREGHAVLHRLRADRLEPPARRDRVRREGDPARRLREDRRDAAARGRAARHGDLRRAGQPGHQDPQVQHRDVHPAHLRRACGRVGADRARGRAAAVLQDAVVEEGHRDGRRPVGEHRDRVLPLLGRLRVLRQPPGPRRSTPARRRSARSATASSPTPSSA